MIFPCDFSVIPATLASLTGETSPESDEIKPDEDAIGIFGELETALIIAVANRVWVGNKVILGFAGTVWLFTGALVALGAVVGVGEGRAILIFNGV